MSDEVYRKLAKVLDTLPNGFPATESGVEIKLLKKVFAPDEAELFMDLRLKFETPEQIAARTGRPLAELKTKLKTMGEKGQLFAIEFGTMNVYKMMPWAFGIYEFQLPRLDREFCELNEEFGKAFGPQFFGNLPSLMQVLPVQKEITAEHQALTYEMVSSIVESSQSIAVAHCICKKEKALLDQSCDRTIQVCMAFAPVPNIFKNDDLHRVITKDEAYALLAKAEEEALVHLTWNTQKGHFFICNCCGCCCGVLRGITEMGIPAGLVVNSHYYAQIDPDECASCGTCADERCQVNAIEQGDDAYAVDPKKCIGCGLCISTCPQQAIALVRKPEAECIVPPQDETDWYETRGKLRGVDFSKYK
jgi:Na+-translocating ferredoxin:NAD+ oxidoreductase subunit B